MKTLQIVTGARQRMRHFVRNRCTGFSLVELVLAIAVFSFCLVSLMAVMPVGLGLNRNTLANTEAVAIVRSVLSDIRTVNADTRKTSRYKLDLSTPSGASTPSKTLYFLDNGTFTATAPTASGGTVARYRLDFANISASTVRILVSWPVPAGAGANAWPTGQPGFYEVVATVQQ